MICAPQQAGEALPLQQQQQQQQSSLNPFRGIGSDLEHSTSLAPPAFLESGFANSYTAPANPSALRKQAVAFDEGLGAQPKRESRRPPISAFQHAASQDCEPLLILSTLLQKPP